MIRQSKSSVFDIILFCMLLISQAAVAAPESSRIERLFGFAQEEQKNITIYEHEHEVLCEQ